MAKVRADHAAVAAANAITETAAAAVLGIARGTLARWRTAGKLPEGLYTRSHKRLIAYSRDALMAFKASLAAPVAA